MRLLGWCGTGFWGFWFRLFTLGLGVYSLFWLWFCAMVCFSFFWGVADFLFVFVWIGYFAGWALICQFWVGFALLFCLTLCFWFVVWVLGERCLLWLVGLVWILDVHLGLNLILVCFEWRFVMLCYCVLVLCLFALWFWFVDWHLWLLWVWILAFVFWFWWLFALWFCLRWFSCDFGFICWLKLWV